MCQVLVAMVNFMWVRRFPSINDVEERQLSLQCRLGMIKRHTIEGAPMSQTKVAITIEEGMLAKVDALVRRKVFSNRSRAIQNAVQEKLERLERSRLAEECAKLDPSFEKAMADEGLSEELAAWPKY